MVVPEASEGERNEREETRTMEQGSKVQDRSGGGERREDDRTDCGGAQGPPQPSERVEEATA